MVRDACQARIFTGDSLPTTRNLSLGLIDLKISWSLCLPGFQRVKHNSECRYINNTDKYLNQGILKASCLQSEIRESREWQGERKGTDASVCLQIHTGCKELGCWNETNVICFLLTSPSKHCWLPVLIPCFFHAGISTLRNDNRHTHLDICTCC